MTDYPGIERRPFGTTKGGEAVEAYLLTNRKGATVTILSYAGTIADVMVPDREGKLGSVTLGFDELAPFEASPHFGALVGRVANRIAKGKFNLEGKEYSLAINNGPNALHGGPTGYSRRVWTVEPRHSTEGPSLRLRIDDPDGHEGYPGHVEVEVVYTWTDADVLRIQYRATTDAPTPINLTNHAYWNLKDAGATDVRGHILRLDADAYTPVDDTLIPIGEIRSVDGTPFDFREPKPIGAEIDEAGGYDHNFVLKSENADFEPEAGYNQNFVLRPGGRRLQLCAIVDEPTTHRHMEVWTDQPGVQFYTGNFLDGSQVGRAGTIARHSGFCLETQHYPDSINQPSFPNTVLRPGETFESTTEYRFSVATTL
jgi:aldose 1-epimerase